MTTLGPGVTVDRYRLVAPAGEGGQASVWRAEDPLHEGATVALKIVPLNAASPASIERFRREARALARLAHPSLPRCHALFEDLRHDLIGIALDFIEGSPLSVLMASETLTTEHRIWVLRHLAAALAYIHDAGLVHRDVKPQNVMIGSGFLAHPDAPEGVKLVDFGIAAEPDNPRPITVTGSVIGTNQYLAPEVIDRTFWKKERSDGPERDVFALGVLGFELLHGKHPTGLGSDVPLGDFMLAYREHGSRDAHDAPTWPPGSSGAAGHGEPIDAFFRGALALHASRRAKDGAALVALLGASGTVPVPPARTAKGPSLGSKPTPTAELGPMATRVVARRSNGIIAGLVAGGAALFAVSFYLSYSRHPSALAVPRLPVELTDGPRSGPTSMEEPPDPPEPAKPTRPDPSAGRVTPVAPASVSCPADMIAVAGPPPFCIDKHEVSVADYRRCAACGAAKEAYWVGATATDSARKEQSVNCTNTRTGLDNYPINCVSFQDATAYCASVAKRLPRISEWRVARSSLTLCGEVGGVCPMFEWAADPAPLQGYRATRGPSFRHPTTLEGTNVEVARNDDLGFRCALDAGK